MSSPARTRRHGPPSPPLAGWTLVELLVTVGCGGLILAALGALVWGWMTPSEDIRERRALEREARFAMQRIADALRNAGQLLAPLIENPATAWLESDRNILALTLDPLLDRDGDGFADADNDRDGRVDEDLGADNTNDGVAGIIGLDINGDGLVNNGHASDDDEDGFRDEDPKDGLDDDGDGSADEDIGARMVGGIGSQNDDGDGLTNEDWYDVVAFFVRAGQLIQRTPKLGAVNGADFVEQAIAGNVTQFRVRRLPAAAGDRAVFVEVTLTLTGPRGQSVTLVSRLRVGRGR